MSTLFDNDPEYKHVYRRDSRGRFATELEAKYERAKHDAAVYKNMYLIAMSRINGIAKILRLKDEEISTLKANFNHK
jgi:hypothetical protein